MNEISSAYDSEGNLIIVIPATPTTYYDEVFIPAAHLKPVAAHLYSKLLENDPSWKVQHKHVPGIKTLCIPVIEADPETDEIVERLLNERKTKIKRKPLTKKRNS